VGLFAFVPQKHRGKKQSTRHPEKQFDKLREPIHNHIMSKTMNVGGMTMTITGSSRTARPFDGKTLRRVFVTLPNVGTQEGGLQMELTSFDGQAVEVYTLSEGIMMYRGTVRSYFPCPQGQAWLRAAWLHEQPSKAARKAFEASCLSRSEEECNAA
jgi:hypothetical protein